MTDALMDLAKGRDFEGVRGAYVSCSVAEVGEVADYLREADIYHVAIELYTWLLSRQETGEAHFGIGQCHGKVYDYDTAVIHLGRAFELDAGRSEGASYYAYILERLGRLDEAAPWYERALAGADSEDLWARSHHAWFLEKWSKPDEAIAAFQDVLERNPGYTWAVKRYALLLRGLGRDTDAEVVIAGAVERDPASLFARLNLLEYRLIAEDGAGYVQVRGTVVPTAGPPWHAVVVELFDLCREVLLPRALDVDRIASWEASAQALTDSVHRDFDDLTDLLSARGADVATWRRLIGLLLK